MAILPAAACSLRSMNWCVVIELLVWLVICCVLIELMCRYWTNKEEDKLSRNSCIKKGSDFTSWSILKGREICHLGLLKGPIGLIDEWYGFEKSRNRSVFKIACSQTLYFLFKVRRARVIKYKPQGIYCPPVQGGRNEKKNKTTSVCSCYFWDWFLC